MKCRVINQRQADKLRGEKIRELSPVAITAMLTVCEEKLHFGPEKLCKAAREICYSYDSIAKDYISFDELKESLEESDGVTIPYDFDHFFKYDTKEDVTAAAVYAQKAFACAVLCTELCDKFRFGAKKAQQAADQVCRVFDELHQNRAYYTQKVQKFYNEYRFDIS